jgi:hypothetical protein
VRIPKEKYDPFLVLKLVKEHRGIGEGFDRAVTEALGRAAMSEASFGKEPAT